MLIIVSSQPYCVPHLSCAFVVTLTFLPHRTPQFLCTHEQLTKYASMNPTACHHNTQSVNGGDDDDSNAGRRLPTCGNKHCWSVGAGRCMTSFVFNLNYFFLYFARTLRWVNVLLSVFIPYLSWAFWFWYSGEQQVWYLTRHLKWTWVWNDNYWMFWKYYGIKDRS